MLEYIEKLSHPGEEPKLVVIWLHGLGADGNDFVPVVAELKLTQCVKFIFPHATLMPVTINNGYVMRAWYDIKSFDADEKLVDTAGIEHTCIAINELIDKQMALGVLPHNIILAGFSQGGVISYVTGTRCQHKLGGILALSCYWPYSGQPPQPTVQNKTMPILACHGVEDAVVPFAAGVLAHKKLKDAGYNIQWREYRMGHSVCNEEIVDIATWFLSLEQLTIV